ncbi:MAG: toll/interleukin-1 receptor domain-containing protein [Nisaea sp.]
MVELRPKVFICHSSSDKPIVRKLALALETRGAQVWLDEWEMLVGDSLLEKIPKGIDTADWLIAVISANTVGSKWVQEELKIATMREIEDEKVFILPAVVDNCTIPPFLRSKIYADFRESFKIGLDILLARILPNHQIRPSLKPYIVKLHSWIIDIDDNREGHAKLTFNSIIVPVRPDVSSIELLDLTPGSPNLLLENIKLSDFDKSQMNYSLTNIGGTGAVKIKLKNNMIEGKKYNVEMKFDLKGTFSEENQSFIQRIFHHIDGKFHVLVSTPKQLPIERETVSAKISIDGKEINTTNDVYISADSTIIEHEILYPETGSYYVLEWIRVGW